MPNLKPYDAINYLTTQTQSKSIESIQVIYSMKQVRRFILDLNQ